MLTISTLSALLFAKSRSVQREAHREYFETNMAPGAPIHNGSEFAGEIVNVAQIKLRED